VVLQRDEPALHAAVVGKLRELAGLDAGFPVGAADLVLDHFHAVQPVFNVIAPDEQTPLVPFANRLGDVLHGWVDGVV